MAKVLLIEPPFHRFMNFHRHYFPLGLAYIAAVLGKYHDVLIYDAERCSTTIPKKYSEMIEDYKYYLSGLSNNSHPIWNEILETVKKADPDIVGISALSVKVPTVIRIIQIIKEFNDNIRVIIGGEHATVSPDEFLKNGADLIVRGEGEMIMLELVNSMEAGQCVKDISGISFMENNIIYNNPRRQLIENLDSLPFPEREKFFNSQGYRPVDFGLIMGSRGCVYDCHFCSNRNIWGNQARIRSVESVIKEIELVKNKFGTKYFSFRDYSFTYRRKWVVDFCHALKNRNLDIEWECLTRCDIIDNYLVRLMMELGCINFRIGIESGSEKMLKFMNKGITIPVITNAAKILNDNKTFWSSYFIFGLPDETKSDIYETLALIERIDPSFVSMSRFTPLPGTYFYDYLIKNGKLTEPINWAEWGNQYLGRNFMKNTTKEEFVDIIGNISKMIDDRNRYKSNGRSDPLLS
jgi:anaerobic magnesium-protoporphyrin IX monomethyl ester cyclase